MRSTPSLRRLSFFKRMRSVLFIGATALSYVLLRGWPEAWHPITRVLLSVTLLILSLGFLGKASTLKSKKAEPKKSFQWLDRLSNTILLLLGSCLLLIVFSITPQVGESLATEFNDILHPELGNKESATGSRSSKADPSNALSSQSNGNWLFPSLGNRPLEKSARLRPSNRPEVYLFPKTIEDTQRLLQTERYLRMFTLATYDHGQWKIDPTIPISHSANEGTIFFQDNPREPISYEISHQANFPDQTFAITLPEVASVKLPSLRETAPDTFRLPPPKQESANYRYEVTSTPALFEQIQEPILPGTSPSPLYLELPENSNLRSKIQHVAQTFDQRRDDCLLQLRRLFESNFQYSLEIEMPDQLDPLEAFLFETHTGYCTHFASATVMLARALGYPARMAYGWSGGRYFRGPQFFVFRAREAHAWAEIFIKDHGWVVFETTPASRAEGIATIAAQDEPSPLEEPDEIGLESQQASFSPLLKATASIGGILLGILLVVMILRRPPSRLIKHLPREQFTIAQPNYLTAFRKACIDRGFPMPPGRTLRAHLHQIEAPSFTKELLSYHYQVHYGNSPRQKAKEKKFLSQLREWEKEPLKKD